MTVSPDAMIIFGKFCFHPKLSDTFICQHCPKQVLLHTTYIMVIQVVESAGGKKLEIFLPKNQHTQRKLLNFEHWVNGEVSKSAKIGLSKIIRNFRMFLNLGPHFLITSVYFP